MYKLFIAVAYRKVLFVLIVLLTFLLVIAASLLKPVMYKSTAIIQLIPKEVTNFNQSANATTIKFNETSFYKTQYEILQSKTLAYRVINRLSNTDIKKTNRQIGLEVIAKNLNLYDSFFGRESKLMNKIHEKIEEKLFSKILITFLASNHSLKDKEILLSSFQKQLKILPVVNTQLVHIIFSSADKNLSAKIANLFVEEYMELSHEGYNIKTSKIKTIVLESIEKIRNKISKIEQDIEHFTKLSNLIITSPGNNPYIDNISTLDQALLSSTIAKISAKSSLDAISHIGISSYDGIIKNGLIQNIKEKKLELIGEYQKKLKIYKPSYPEMVQLKKQIIELDKVILRESKNVKGNLLINYKSMEKKEKGIESLLKISKQKYQVYLSNISKYNELRRDLDIEEVLYGNFLKRLKEIDVVDAAKIDNVHILEKAEVPQFSYSPNYVIALTMGGIIALLLGVSISGIVDSLDKSIKTLSDIDKTITDNICFVGRFKLKTFGVKKYKQRIIQEILAKLRSLDHNNKIRVITLLGLNNTKSNNDTTYKIIYLNLVDFFLQKKLNTMIISLNSDTLKIENKYGLKKAQVITCSNYNDALSLRVSETTNISHSILQSETFFPVVGGNNLFFNYIKDLNKEYDVVLLLLSDISKQPELIAYLESIDVIITCVYKRKTLLNDLKSLVSKLTSYTKIKHIILYV